MTMSDNVTPRFIHVDHSLCNPGGHEYIYAQNLLSAAERAGYQAVLAANRRFQDHATLPPTWPVHACFPSLLKRFQLRSDPVLSRVAHGGGVNRSIRDRWRLFCDQRHQIRRRACFIRSATRLFTELELRLGDVVFFATFSDADFAALRVILDQVPQSIAASWHVLMHFDSDGYSGTRPELIQVWRATFSQRIKQFERHVPDHQLHFHATTAELASFCRRRSDVEFGHLPFAIKQPVPSEPKKSRQRIRVVCAGAMRAEKGVARLAALTHDLRNQQDLASRIEFVTQISKRKLQRSGLMVSANQDSAEGLRMVHWPHPLPTKEYERLIGETDIGLFLYDAWRYRRRCSGVLHEMLAAGKPVIVPAGSWLGQQIAEPLETHLAFVCQQSKCVAAFDLDTLQGCAFPSTLQDEVFSKSVELPIPKSANLGILRVHWPRTVALASWLTVQATQIGADNHSVQSHAAVLTPPYAGDTTSTLLRLTPGADRVVVRLGSQRNVDSMAVSAVTCQFLQVSESNPPPVGRVGLSYTSPAEIPALLHDMVRHFDHYASSAREFARTYREEHEPKHTIDRLTGRAACAPSWKRVRAA
jgi:hypothetical protein